MMSRNLISKMGRTMGLALILCATIQVSFADASGLECVDLFQAKSLIDVTKGVDIGLFEKMASRYQSPQHRLLQDVVQSQGLSVLRASRSVAPDHDINYTYALSERPVRGNQGQTGSCFIWAPLTAVEEFHMSNGTLLPGQTLSRPYIIFMDYLERSASHIDKIISLRMNSERIHNDTILSTLKTKVADGGYVEDVLFLIKKYGLVLDSDMPDNANSLNSAPVLEALNNYLLIKTNELWELSEGFDKSAVLLHDRIMKVQYERNKKFDVIDLQKINAEQAKVLGAKKQEILEGVFKILETNLGTPPITFTAKIPAVDPKTKRMNSRVVTFTPQQFALEYLQVNPDDWVNVSNLRTRPRNQVYQVQYQDMNVPRKILNLGPAAMAKIVKASIMGQVRVPFDSNFGPGVNMKTGDIKMGSDSTAGLYGFSKGQAPRRLSKLEMTNLGITQADHETVFYAVDLPNGETIPTAFGVENSWTAAYGVNGNFRGDRSWFSTEVDGIMVHRSFLTPKQLAIYDSQPVIMPAKDE